MNACLIGHAVAAKRKLYFPVGDGRSLCRFFGMPSLRRPASGLESPGLMGKTLLLTSSINKYFSDPDVGKPLPLRQSVNVLCISAAAEAIWVST
jgi:hypothetical protein